MRSRLPLSLSAPAWFAVATALSAAFLVLVRPFLETVPYDFDEAWLILDARSFLGGLRPFLDFPHHDPPLHLYLLALSAKIFGPTLFGFRMLSALSVAASGFLLFCLTRPFVGPLPALVAQAVFLFSEVQVRAVDAIPEAPSILFTLLGAVLLFLGTGTASACAGGLAFVVALLIKPTCLPMVLAAALSLAWARQWRRLGALALTGIGASAIGLVWANVLSDGVFADLLRFQIERIGTRRTGMWSIDSGFTDIARITGVDTPAKLALASLKGLTSFPASTLPMALLLISLLGLPIWLMRCGRSRPALRAFALLWPASYLLLNFVALDFVSPRYFLPYFAFSAFFVAALAWTALRSLPTAVAATATAVVCVALAGHLIATLRAGQDLWYFQRAAWIAYKEPTLVSFTPMLFAATGTEPGCDLRNPADTYGGFGDTFLVTDRIRKFAFSDERIIQCLKADPKARMVVDWAFYFFTRPGGPLREYLAGEGKPQRLFFSPEAMDQWDRPVLSMSPFR